MRTDMHKPIGACVHSFPQNLQYTYSREVEKSNIHGLRYTFAREWFLNGGDVVQLSKILGHSTLAISEHYMNVYADMARDRFVEYNPLDNITTATCFRIVAMTCQSAANGLPMPLPVCRSRSKVF